MGARQRSLVNRRISFLDGEIVTKYLFPFWDREWAVRFILLDVFGGHRPLVLAGPLESRGALLAADSPVGTARPLGETARLSFDGMYHFDPWWVFRGTAGVGREYQDVILPTNVARKFRVGNAEWKVHDVDFGPRVQSVVGIEAKDEMYRKQTFTKANLELGSTFATVQARRSRASATDD